MSVSDDGGMNSDQWSLNSTNAVMEASAVYADAAQPSRLDLIDERGTILRGNLRRLNNDVLDSLQRCSGWFPVYDANGELTGLEVADFVHMDVHRVNSIGESCGSFSSDAQASNATSEEGCQMEDEVEWQTGNELNDGSSQGYTRYADDLLGPVKGIR